MTVGTVFKLVPGTEGQWSWFWKRQSWALARQKYLTSTFWKCRSYKKAYGKLLAVELEVVRPVWPWVLWPYSEAGIILLQKLHPRFVNVICWTRRRHRIVLVCFFVYCSSPGVSFVPRRVFIPVRASWRRIPASTYGPAHENKNWQTLDTRNNQAKAHIHSQLVIITQSVLRQIHSLFQSEFSTQRRSNTLSLP